MGSYLSIVNNTPNPWLCHLGTDMMALKIAGIIIAVIGAAATVIATAGAAAPLAAALTANGVVSVFGVSTAALATVTAGAAAISTATTAIGSVSGFAIAVAKGVTDNLISQDYHPIQPSQSYRWGKMTLSLWQQGTCQRTTIVDEYTVRTDTLYMRPIFSGSTANSNRNHDIQWWINKNGVTSKEVKAEKKAHNLQETAAAGGHVFYYHQGDQNVTDTDFEEGDVIYIYPQSE